MTGPPPPWYPDPVDAWGLRDQPQQTQLAPQSHPSLWTPEGGWGTADVLCLPKGKSWWSGDRSKDSDCSRVSPDPVRQVLVLSSFTNEATKSQSSKVAELPEAAELGSGRTWTRARLTLRDLPGHPVS